VDFLRCRGQREVAVHAFQTFCECQLTHGLQLRLKPQQKLLIQLFELLNACIAISTSRYGYGAEDDQQYTFLQYIQMLMARLLLNATEVESL